VQAKSVVTIVSARYSTVAKKYPAKLVIVTSWPTPLPLHDDGEIGTLIVMTVRYGGIRLSLPGF